jgi:hypothetical protein
MASQTCVELFFQKTFHFLIILTQKGKQNKTKSVADSTRFVLLLFEGSCLGFFGSRKNKENKLTFLKVCLFLFCCTEMK